MLYIMRHGQTDWNVASKLQGRVDIPLNENGKAMARAARERYLDTPIDCCFCSPLGRAQETAELMLEGREIPITTEERLTEINFGICEGLVYSFEIDEGPMRDLFFRPDVFVPLEGGESLDEIEERTGAFLRDVVVPLLKEGKHVLLVGHGAMNCSMIGQIRKIPRKQFWDAMTGNCELVPFSTEEVLEALTGEIL